MQITVNGETRDIQPPLSVASLLTEMGLADRPCAVELNHHVIPKAQHPSTTLADGDRLELVTLVGGG